MAAARRRPKIPSRRLALLIGYGGILLGSYALYEAYELRGRARPYAVKFLPGA
jgi:hypothetical protein